jgi:hypothetical protein
MVVAAKKFVGDIAHKLIEVVVLLTLSWCDVL